MQNAVMMHYISLIMRQGKGRNERTKRGEGTKLDNITLQNKNNKTIEKHQKIKKKRRKSKVFIIMMIINDVIINLYQRDLRKWYFLILE